MAKTYTDKVYNGTLTTAETTVDTIATNTTFLLKGIVISNANAADKYATVKIDDKRIIASKPIPTKNSIVLTFDSLPVLTGKTIKVTGEVANDLDYYIWGVNEVTT